MAVRDSRVIKPCVLDDGENYDFVITACFGSKKSFHSNYSSNYSTYRSEKYQILGFNFTKSEQGRS